MFHFFKRKKKNNKKGGDVNVTLEEKLIELTKEGLLTEEELDLIKKNLSKELDAQKDNGDENSVKDEEKEKEVDPKENVDHDSNEEEQKDSDPHPNIDEGGEKKPSVEEIEKEAKTETLDEENKESGQKQAQEENVLIEEINHLRKEVEDLKAQLESSKSIPKKPRIVDSEVNDYGYGTKTIYQK